MTVETRNPITPVRCLSSHSYADRPVSLYWEDRWHPVDKIRTSWRDEDGVHFLLQIPDGRVFKAHYHSADDRWYLELFAR